jgi:hypothetical protein
MLKTVKQYKSHIVCDFCQGNHSCKKCIIGKEASVHIKKIVGDKMETFVADKLQCPNCNKMKLRALHDYTPSLDIVCDECDSKFEVKSKCLSGTTIPHDIELNHGNYRNYLERQSNGLDFIIIIYSVNRQTKIISIRKILHVPNKIINEKKFFIVHKRQYETTSIIKIPDYTQLHDITPNLSYSYNLAETINKLISMLKQNTNTQIEYTKLYANCI